MLGVSERAVRCFPAVVTQITMLLANVIRCTSDGKGAQVYQGLALAVSVHPFTQVRGQTFIPSPIWACPKVSFSCATSSKSVEKQSSARSLCTCPGMCPCATQGVRCEDSCGRFHPGASRHTLLWGSAAAVKRAVTFQGGWTTKPGPGPRESKGAVHSTGADVKGPRIAISGFCT